MKSLCTYLGLGVVAACTIIGVVQQPIFKKSPPPPPPPPSERIQSVLRQLDTPDDWDVVANNLDGVKRPALQHKKTKLFLVLWDDGTASVRDESNIRFTTTEAERRLVHDKILPIIREKDNKKYFP